MSSFEIASVHTAVVTIHNFDLYRILSNDFNSDTQPFSKKCVVSRSDLIAFAHGLEMHHYQQDLVNDFEELYGACIYQDEDTFLFIYSKRSED